MKGTSFEGILPFCISNMQIEWLPNPGEQKSAH